MSATPLFLDSVHKMTFEKIAMPVKLSDTPETWQREIAGEIFKQAPFLSDYAVNVVIDRVDPERGYAFGSAEVMSRSEGTAHEQEELPKVRIPLLVEERLLKPIDVFMDGKGVFPLTADRLREELFRTATFETSTRKPTDKGIVDQLYPPLRTNYGMGSAMGDSMGMGKYALDAETGRIKAVAATKAEANANPSCFMGKGASLIESIASTISDTDADAFVDQIAKDPALAIAAANNDSFSKLAMIIASTSNPSVKKTAEALVGSIKPTVVQLEKLASGDFLVKWANAAAFSPQQGTVDPAMAGNLAGGDLSGMQPGATVTVGTEKAQKQSLKEEHFIQVKEPGTYKVKNTATNEEMFGDVLPVTDFEMQPLEMLLFVNDTCYSLQDEIAGIRQEDAPATQAPPGEVGTLPTVPLQQAQGDGTFVYDVAGKMHSLVPVTIQNIAQTPDGTMEFHAEDSFGEPLTLTVTPGIEAITELGEGNYAIPDFLEWLPLQNPVLLAKQPIETEQGAEAKAAPSAVDVRSTGKGEFSLDGMPLSKVAQNQKWFLKTAQAEFMLVAMGMNPFDARDLLKLASKKGKAKIAGLRSIVPLANIHMDMTKKAALALSDFPFGLRRNLVKEAAALEDKETADKILAMNFLNPENVAIFASYLPELDTASSKLAEMLVACRLGMAQVDEGAVERAMKNLELVIQGLKVLQQKEMI